MYLHRASKDSPGVNLQPSGGLSKQEKWLYSISRLSVSGAVLLAKDIWKG